MIDHKHAFRLTLTGLCALALSAAPLAAKASAPAATDGGPLPVGAVVRLGEARLTHGGPVGAFAFAPDGMLLASVGADGCLRVWETATGHEKRRADIAPDVRHVAWSPDGKTLALGGKNGKLRGFNAETLKELFTLDDTEQAGVATPFAFSADGQTLAYWTRGHIRLYDLQAKKSEWGWSGPHELPTAFAFHPEGKTLAFTHGEVTSIHTPGQVTTDHDKRLDRGNPQTIAFAPDGKLLAIGGERHVYLWDPATSQRQTLSSTFAAPVRAVAFTPDGSGLCAAAEDGQCTVWDFVGGKSERRFRLVPEAPARDTTLRLAITSDGRTLAWSLAGSNGIHLTDTTTGRESMRPDEAAIPVPFAFSPDGRQLLAASADGRVRLWDAANGKLLDTFAGRVTDATGVAFAVDGKRAVAVGRDVVAWEVKTGKELARFAVHNSDFGYVAAVSADGKRVAIGAVDFPTGSAGFTGKVRWYDVDAGKETGRIETPHNGSILALAFDPSGQTLVSAGADHDLCLWDVASGKRFVQVEGGSTTDTRLAFSADGKSLLSAQRHADGRGRKVLRIAVHDADATTQRRSFDADKETSLAAFAPNGSRVALFTAEAGVRVVEMATARTIAEIDCWQAKISRAAFSPDATHLATTATDGTVFVWDLARTPRPAYAPGGGKLPRGGLTSLGGPRLTPRSFAEVLAYSVDGKLLAAGEREGVLIIWDATTGSEVRHFTDLTKRIQRVAWSPDGKSLAVAGEDRRVHVVDIETGTERHTLTPSLLTADPVFAFVPDGRSLVWWSGDGATRRYDLAAKKETQTWTGEGGPAPQFTFTPDGKRLAVLREKAITVYDLSTGKATAEVKEADLSPVAIAFAPDGKTLAAAVGKDVHLWDLTGREPALAVGSTHQSLVRALHYAPAGKTLYSAGEDGECKEWDVTAGREKRRFRLEATRPTFMHTLAFAPDGKSLAWTDRTGLIHLTDVATSEELQPPGDRPLTTVFAFAPDGEQLLTLSVDGSPRLWDATSGQLVRKFDGKAEGVTFIGFFGKKAVTVGEAVIVWDVKTGKEVSRLMDVKPGPKWPAALSGSTLALGQVAPTADAQSKVHWYDLATGKELGHSTGGHTRSILSLAFDRSGGKTLASSGADGNLYLWELATGKELATIALKGNAETKLLFMDRPGAFLSIYYDVTGRLGEETFKWREPKTLNEGNSFLGPRDLRFGAASLDGLRVAWLGKGTTVWVTNLAYKFTEYADLTGHRTPVGTIAFSPDGKRVATGSTDGTILIWDLGRVPRTPLVKQP